jgi:polyhydroxybutyrate depolymerase
MRKAILIFTFMLLAGCGAVADGLLDRADDVERQTLKHGGLERSYVVRVPPAVQRSTAKVPLVLVLHGGGGNAPITEKTTGFTAKALREGFIVVYPEGTGRRDNILLTWNAGHCCGEAMRNRIDDVGFINALLDKLIREYPVDPWRIYVTGISNGGMMSHRLGRELSSRFAAVAPVVATLFGDEPPSRGPVSAVIFNGMLDASVPYKGGAPGGRFSDSWDGTPAQPAQAQSDYWAKANGCKISATDTNRGAYLERRHECPDGRDVVLYLIKDQGHAWPGGQAGTRLSDKPSTALNATDVIWSFFEAHAK